MRSICSLNSDSWKDTGGCQIKGLLSVSGNEKWEKWKMMIIFLIWIMKNEKTWRYSAIKKNSLSLVGVLGNDHFFIL